MATSGKKKNKSEIVSAKRGRTRSYYSRGMVACIPEISKHEVYPVGEFLPPNALVELRDGALWTVDDKLES